MSERRVLVIGATGMVGGAALRICLDRGDVSSVTVIGRRSCGITDAKLTEVLHSNFSDYGDVADRFDGVDVALFCLGAYTGTISDDEFRKVTVEYTVAFAGALSERSPKAAVCFLSGQGADPTEASRMSFARYKGAAEKTLLGAGFSRVHVFRPGYIYPTTPRKEPNLGYRALRNLYPALRRVYPNVGIPSEDLARAMVHAGLDGTGVGEVLENRDIRALASGV